MGGDVLDAPCDMLEADLDLGDALVADRSPLSLSWMALGRSSGYRMSYDLKVPSGTGLAPSLAVLLEAVHVAPNVELLCSFLEVMTSLASPTCAGPPSAEGGWTPGEEGFGRQGSKVGVLFLLALDLPFFFLLASEVARGAG